MTPFIDFDELLRRARDPETEVDYAQRRLTTRTYVSKSFSTPWGRDKGYPGRYIYKVFDERIIGDTESWEWKSEVIFTTPGGRKQVEFHVARESGMVRAIKITKIPATGDREKLENILELDREQTASLISCLKALDHIPVDGNESVKVDDQLLSDLFSDPESFKEVYRADPNKFRRLIEDDSSAKDVIALERRRKVVEIMRTWLEDDTAFDSAAATAGGPEKAWQNLLEDNPWILGIGLGGQLFTRWSEERLEQAVRGRSINGAGKRVDALLRSQGAIRSLALAEIKHHKTELLGRNEYRPDCWAPSKELAGALVQIQQTTHAAVSDLEHFLADKDEDGGAMSTGTYIFRPRSYLIIGSQSEFLGQSGGAIPSKYRSFELFRRNIYEPEVLTFDELLARAEWHVEMAEKEDATGEV